MITAISIILSIIISYLIGSISNGVLVGKIFYGVDIRTLGSHNSGGTNTGRVLGKKAGLITIILDALKSICSILLIYFICSIPAIKDNLTIDKSILCYIGAFSCCIGHCYPIFFKFKGGKIVACLAGICLITNWILTLMGLVIFFTILIISKYVSLGSIITSICLFVLTFIPFVSHGMLLNLTFGLPYSIFMGLVCLLLIIRHHGNIHRLFKGEESKVKWLSRSKSN